MPDRTQEIKNLRQVFTASVNYTDNKIKKVYYDIGHNDITTEDHTDEATYQITAPANAKLLMLQSIAGNSVKYAPTTASDTTSAYQKTIPSYSPSIDRASASMNILGGMSYKVNQLVTNGNFESVSNWGYNGASNRSVNNNIATLTSNGSSSMQLYQQIPTIVGHKYLITGGFKPSVNATMIIRLGSDISGGVSCSANQWTTITRITTASETTSEFNFYHIAGDFSNGDTCDYRKGMVFNLTADFGSGNEPTSVSDCATEYAKRGVDIYSYTPQQSAIRDTAPTSVVSKDSNDTTIDTLSINASIQALDGYGMGYDETCNNYIDFNSKKFVKMYHRYTFTGNESWTYNSTAQRWQTSITVDNSLIPPTNNTTKARLSVNVKVSIISNTYQRAGWEVFGTTGKLNFYINDNDELPSTTNPNTLFVSGKTLDYELATPIETDISQYLDGNEIEIEPNGTLSFESTYSAYVPSNVSYNGVIKHSLATAVKQDGFNVWDEVAEAGTIDNITGNNSNVSERIRSKNYIEALPSTIYYFKAPNTYSSCRIACYDANKNYLGSTSGWLSVNNNSTFTTPSNCYFIRFVVIKTNETYDNDICINISNQDLNGTYKPHKPTITRLLPNSEAKYSWGITDGVRNTRIFCDDEGNPVNEGSLVVGNQDLGGLNYTYESSYSTFKSTISDIYNSLTRNILCYKYETSLVNNWENMNDKEIAKLGTNSTTIMIKDIVMGNNSTIFKSAMSGVPLFYEKNTTDTETLDDFDYFFDCEEGDTFTLVNSENLQCYATYSFLIKEAKSNE